MPGSMLDRIRKSVERAGPAGKISDALNSANKQAEAQAFAADERKYGPRIAREEALKRAKKK